ncbi:conserved Plasmodium protein, unknown function [Plasmodium vinckei vinckei]|uniref:Uncharacterized protein n=1 Tax=Plasmodium vinckei vinckei TaxID=54757 RepID=A0A449BWD5_PLAVN|nr:conserved Plasmodium protein, unknown function [Plasmodium vinckei vinckei]KEG03503.1 hypothetical protein YYE_01527 [Plasmodium vinckei vinckei]VEV57795.1 conserved Plasmodium protein, unknown function [Plasmodium vinckei vinckei]
MTEHTDLIDAGCFISQMNELLLIDPLYMNYAITNYFNYLINDKSELLPKESLNGVYFENAKPGLWSSFAIKEKNIFLPNSQQMEQNMNDLGIDKNYGNEIITSFACFNNTEFMHEYLTVEKLNKLNWEKLESNINCIGGLNNDNTYKNQSNEEDNPINFSNYFTNILTVESGQVGLFCTESIKNCTNALLEKYEIYDIKNKEELDNFFNKNMNDLYSWYNKICNTTLSSSIAIIDYIDMPLGSVCMSGSDCVSNYLCEVVKDDITGEIWAIRVNFLNPFK